VRCNPTGQLGFRSAFINCDRPTAGFRLDVSLQDGIDSDPNTDLDTDLDTVSDSETRLGPCCQPGGKRRGLAQEASHAILVYEAF